MDSKYKNAYEKLKKNREERQKASSQAQDRYKDYADAYAVLRGEKKSGESKQESTTKRSFYAPDSDSPAIPVRASTSQIALNRLIGRKEKQETSDTSTNPIKTDAREVYQKKGTTPTLGGGKTVDIVKQQSGLSYIQRKGQEAFANAMDAIDKTGKAAVPAVKAFLNNLSTQFNHADSVKNEMAEALKSGNKEDAKSISVKPMVEFNSTAKSEAKKAFNESLTEQYEEEQKMVDLLGDESDYADTDPAYEKARSNQFVKTLGDLNASTAYMLPSVMMSYATGNPASMLSSVLSASTIAAQAYSDAFDEAKREGATTEQAGQYAMKEAANQALGDMLIGGVAGVGSGFIDSTVGKYAGKALNRFISSRPVLKAFSKLSLKSIGEGTEEVIQSLVTTHNKRTTYNPEAKVSLSDLAYEGILGTLMGTVYALPSLPADYAVYRSDYDTVNALSKAADSVKSEEDAQKVIQTANMMVSMCEEEISSLKSEEQTDETKENISRLEYIRDGATSVKAELEAHENEITSHNTAVSDALQAVGDGAAEDIVQNVSELVNVVSDGIEPDKDPLNATIDVVREEIQNADTRIKNATTPSEKKEAELDRRMLIVIDNTIRENRKSIEEILKEKRNAIDWNGIEEAGNAVRKELENIFESPESDSVETAETELQNNTESDTIENVEESTTEIAPKEFKLHHFVHTDTRDGKKLNVFQSTNKLSSEEYKKLKQYFSDIGGYYSRYVKGFILPDESKIGNVANFADTDYKAENNAENTTVTSSVSKLEKDVTGYEENKKDAIETVPTQQPSEKTDVIKTDDVMAEEENDTKTPSVKISDFVFDNLSSGNKITMQDLQNASNSAYGGTMAEGAYDVKAMTDALELGINRYIIEMVGNNQSDFNTDNPNDAIESIKKIDEDILSNIPTQTKRTDEQISLQQFSTPPNIAYVASWVANIDGTDTVLEPSAGIGGLASFAKADGATVFVNELSDSRLEMLKNLPFDGFYHENAEQIDNILPDPVSPSVVIMNPPFSSTGGRTKNTTKNAIPHIEQALYRLQDGGRLVAIVGKGMADDTPTFKDWYNTLRETYNIRANIGINGENYRKYGTTFDVQLLVIDKTGSQTGETITGNYDDLKEIPEILKGVRNDRNRTNQQNTSGTGSKENHGNAVYGTESKENMVDTVSARDSGNGTAERVGTTGNSTRKDSGRRKNDDSNSISGKQSQNVSEPDTAGGNGTDGSGLGSTVSRNTEESARISKEEPSSVSAENAVRTGDGESNVRERLADGRRSDGGTDGQSLVKKSAAPKKAAEKDDGVYATYKPAPLTVKGAKKHPAILVESSAMSAVSSPELHYIPKLDQKLITGGALSDAQLENISYAGQAHEQVLKNGARKGYFIGDGTGVGKGRQVSGIILDNFNQGRRKAVWVSEKQNLYEDAIRDWVDLGGKAEDVHSYQKENKKGIGRFDEGIMFITYSTLRGGPKNGKSHLDTILEWLGTDFDGVIVFDESHNMANSITTQGARGAKEPSKAAITANKLQDSVKNARVVYASATGATNIENFAYLQRLGLWGEGTQFVNEQDFITKIGRAGIAAMELVSRDMKAMGVYLARSISFDGVKYDKLNHNLTKDQKYMYDTMSDGWQIVVQNVEKAAQITGSANNAGAKARVNTVWGTMQNFYNAVLTSFSMPSVIKDIEKELKAGNSCVIQLVNTYEAAQEKAVAKMREEGETDYDNLDLTPRQMLESYIMNAFPVQQYEEYLDEKGNKLSRPVTDSSGNPVLNKQAVRMRDELLEKIKDISIPESPIDMLINHFGVDQVAEITGRKNRFINKTDENGDIKKVKDTRDSQKANIAETKDFQDGKKRILVFSEAGATGRSYHADKRAKNQQQRIHYILQPGWRADKAVQSTGRTHRSNQVNTPTYKLVSTDVAGQKRFVTSVARRLEQLGALTKGQRQTGSGIFDASDNMESDLSREALREFYKKLGAGQLEGINPEKTLKGMGLYRKFYDEFGVFKLNEVVAADIPQFLNRVLALKVDEDNRVFQAYENIRQAYYESAMENGTLDTGMENVKADKIEIGYENIVHTDNDTGAETKYIRATALNKPIVLRSIEDVKAHRPNFNGIYRLEDGSIRAAYRISDMTDAWGRVVKRYRLQSANTFVSNTMNERNLDVKAEKIPESAWNDVWNEAIKDIPEYNETEIHMITGALLPIWNQLPSDGTTKAMRITASDGTQYLGRIIPPKQIDAVLRNFDVKGAEKTYIGKEIQDDVLKKAQNVVFNGQYGGTLTVSRRRVSGENRMEITGGNLFAIKAKYPDVISETIEFKTRYFIPSGAKGTKILDEMIQNLKIRSVGKENDGDVYYKRKSVKETIRESRDSLNDVPPSLDELKIAAEKMFRVPINYGKTGGRAGLYKSKDGTIRVAQPGDFLTIAHEIGHRLETRYNLHGISEVSELKPGFYKALKEEGYSETQIPYEMVAEYIKTYLENANVAVGDYPKFTQAVFEILDKRDADNLNRLAVMSNAYYDSDAGKRAQASVHNRAEENAPLNRFSASLKEAKHDPRGYIGTASKRLWDGLIKNFFDDLYALKHFGSTYSMAMRERQSNSVIRGWLTGNATDKYGNVLGEGLSGRLSEFGITPANRKEFDSYLVDLVALDHMKQEQEKPSGRPMGGRVYADERVQAGVVDRIGKMESKNPGFHDAAQAMFRYDDILLERAVQSGILSAETAKEWKEKYPHYSPLYRVMDDKAKISGKARSRYTDQNNVFKGFKGSGRDIYSPVENRMLQTETILKSSMRNDVALALFDYIDNNTEMGIFAEKVPQSMYKDVIGLFPAYQKLEKFDFESLKMLSEAERQNVLDEVQEAMGMVVESWKPKQYQGKNIVAVMRNGTPEFYEIHDKAVLDAITSLSGEEMGVVAKVFSEITKTFKVVTTGSNPFFAVTNFVRDTQSGYVSSTTTNNPVTYVVDLAKAIIDTIKKSDDYKRFMDVGGGYEGSMTRDMGTLRSVEWSMVPHSTIERILHTPVKIWDGFAKLVDIGESAQRLAEFKRAEKAGNDCLEAMRKQQEITVNFSRRGKISKEIDQVVPYFNASLQSFYHLFEVLNGNTDPKTKMNVWKKFITANITMSLLQQAFLVIGSAITGEDEEKEYNELSGYIKNAYWCFPRGDGKFIRIPKQKDFMLLSTIIDRTVEYAYHENPRAFYEFSDYMTGVLMAPHSIEDVTMFGTAFALAKNEAFTGAPIVPYAYQNLIPEEQFNENTSSVAKYIGDILNISPMQIQYVMDDTSGFVGQFIEYFGDIASSVKDDGIAAGLKTGFDEFTSTFRSDNTYSTDEISYFYDTKDSYDTKSATYKIRGNGKDYGFYDTYGAYKYGKIADVYSKCNGLLKKETNQETARTQRQVLNSFIKSINDTKVTQMDEEVASIAEASGTDVSGIAPYIVTPDQITVRKNNNSYYVELTLSDMLEYYTEASIMFELNYTAILQSEGTATAKAEALESVRKEINDYMRDQWFDKIMERDGVKTK